MSRSPAQDREVERRAWVERHEQFRDVEAEYHRLLRQAASEEARRAITRRFSDLRRANREADVEIGKRLPGLGIATRKNMWTEWLEIAVERELEARDAYAEIVANPNSAPLSREFRASLVAIPAAAYTIEALYGDVKYRIPPQRRRGPRHRDVRRALRFAFGIPEVDDTRLAGDLKWLFDLRNRAAHPYTETIPVQPHPAGINTGVEHSWYNAITSERAIDIAVGLLAFAEAPPNPHNDWITRWGVRRAAYFDKVRTLRHRRLAHASE